MSAVAKSLSVTVGTLTIAMNHLVKRICRAQEKRGRQESSSCIFVRKRRRAYHHHRMFHETMVMAVMKDLDRQETEALTEALMKLQDFFRNYREE